MGLWQFLARSYFLTEYWRLWIYGSFWCVPIFSWNIGGYGFMAVFGAFLFSYGILEVMDLW
jgi:hypothetical protein